MTIVTLYIVAKGKFNTAEELKEAFPVSWNTCIPGPERMSSTGFCLPCAVPPGYEYLARTTPVSYFIAFSMEKIRFYEHKYSSVIRREVFWLPSSYCTMNSQYFLLISKFLSHLEICVSLILLSYLLIIS